MLEEVGLPHTVCAINLGRLEQREPWFLAIKARSVALQWLMFQRGGIGPMQGQANVFFRYAPEKIQYAIDRYQNETRRLYEVLETRLAKAEYLARGGYSIADIATWPWVSIHSWAGVFLDGLRAVGRWLEAVGKRPAVQRGRAVPAIPAPPAREEVVESGRKMLA